MDNTQQIIYQEAKDRLASSRDDINDLSKKSFVLISLYIAIIGSVTVLTAKYGASIPVFTIWLGASISTGIVLVGSIKTSSFAGMGSDPSVLVSSPFDKSNADDLLISVALSHGEKAQYNCDKAKTRGKAINASVIVIFLTVVAAGFALILC